MKQNRHPYEETRRRLAGMVLPAVAALNRHSDRWLEDRLKRIGVSLAEMRIVGALLGDSAGISQRELAARLGVRPATISAALPSLECIGLIERQHDPNDARANIVRLRHVENALDPVIAIMDELEAILFGAVLPDERARLRDQLAAAAQRIGAATEAADPGDEPGPTPEPNGLNEPSQPGGRRKP